MSSQDTRADGSRGFREASVRWTSALVCPRMWSESQALGGVRLREISGALCASYRQHGFEVSDDLSGCSNALLTVNQQYLTVFPGLP